MDKTYTPKRFESHWYTHWEQQNLFKPSGEEAAIPHCIMLPPPNVTGSLHMGHAFQQTLMDILIRKARMCGADVLWQCGSDHAGIATQMVVERQLEAEGKTRHDLGRTAFVQRAWDWKEHSGDIISTQSRRLGSSMDWSRERFTLDAGMAEAVQKTFIQLFEEGLIYRGQRLVNWDPVLCTAISDLEVASIEENGKLWRLRYPLADDPSRYLAVATTRPETLLGDAAVAVHPEDERYGDLIGLEVLLPIAQRRIPIIADKYVDPEFGSGCVKITPAHDFNDYHVGKRHDLPLINIFDESACLNENAPAGYRGLDRYAARKRILSELEAAGLLESCDAHRMMIPRGDRSGAVIEPWLTDQWYVRVAPLAKVAIAAVERGEVRFVPENWRNSWLEWMNNIEDWCISRQLWWGHRIPAWHAPNGAIYVGKNERDVRAKHNLSDDLPLTQDEDVLDTWFSSALWPFSSLGWPKRSRELARYYPTDVLVTGFDILFFWVARMIMMGLHCMDQAPFREVYIHGLVRDSQGQKMSKSKGNILDPLDLIDGIELEPLVRKRTTGLMQPAQASAIEAFTRRDFPNGISAYGADSLRFAFASLATQGRDIRFSVGRIQGYRNFCNKLWNASRYVLMNCSSSVAQADAPALLADRWICARLAETIDLVNEHITNYRFDLATQALYEFVWSEYCDWYLEWTKPLLNDTQASATAKAQTRYTLLFVLETLLRLLHPFIPFITEELWQRVAPVLGISGETIMLQAWPKSAALFKDPAAVEEMAWLQAFIGGVRKIRAERNLPLRMPLAAQVKGSNSAERAWLKKHEEILCQMAHLSDIFRTEREPADAAAVLVGDTLLLIPLAELIDMDAELAKLDRSLAELSKIQQIAQSRLEQANFVERAPAAVVDKERQRLAKTLESIQKLQAQRSRINHMRQTNA
ncbi:MAG: valine--tRNA ligase [Candidatus Eutrophobiaceae bacterium]